MSDLRIVVADDHPVVREGLVSIITTDPGFQVVGEAATGRATLSEVERQDPDVLLLDLEMPEGDGIEVIRHLNDAGSRTRILVLTAFDRDDQIVQALQAGASGYLLKGAPREEIFRAIRTVARGGSTIAPMVATKLLKKVREEPDLLTPRELEVLQLVGEGCSNKAIGKRLFVSERTVKFHVSRVMAKLGASNRTEAVALARKRGILD